MNNNQGDRLQYEFTSLEDMMFYAHYKAWGHHLKTVLTDMHVKRELREILKTEVKNKVILEGDAEDLKRFADWLFKCTLDGEQFVDNGVVRRVDSD